MGKKKESMLKRALLVGVKGFVSSLATMVLLILTIGLLTWLISLAVEIPRAMLWVIGSLSQLIGIAVWGWISHKWWSWT